jgi:hypothetical protein
MDSTHIRWLEESLEKNTVQKILKAENGRIRKDKESMTEKRNQRELLWFQTGGALNFIITAAPHCEETMVDGDKHLKMEGGLLLLRSYINTLNERNKLFPSNLPDLQKRQF